MLSDQREAYQLSLIGRQEGVADSGSILALPLCTPLAQCPTRCRTATGGNTIRMATAGHYQRQQCLQLSLLAAACRIKTARLLLAATAAKLALQRPSAGGRLWAHCAYARPRGGCSTGLCPQWRSQLALPAVLCSQRHCLVLLAAVQPITAIGGHSAVALQAPAANRFKRYATLSATAAASYRGYLSYPRYSI